MLSKIKKFIKDYQNDIILAVGVILISLFSFAAGYLLAKNQQKQPLRFEEIKQETFYFGYSFNG